LRGLALPFRKSQKPKGFGDRGKVDCLKNNGYENCKLMDLNRDLNLFLRLWISSY
jgi:hypothetical protein